MSTVEREQTATIPPLVDGERLNRAMFHERYEAMPESTRAELIGGVEVMASPVGPGHGDFVYAVTTWAGHYSRKVPGLKGGCDATHMLDDLAEVQLDVSLRVLPEYGGQTRIERGYIAGAPELAIEVAHSSKGKDLGDKLEDYRRTGVLEYVVVMLKPEAVHWFVRRGDQLVPMPPGADGIFRSEQFPGLWLDPIALFDEDVDCLLATLERGLATPEHAEFAHRMKAHRQA